MLKTITCNCKSTTQLRLYIYNWLYLMNPPFFWPACWPGLCEGWWGWTWACGSEEEGTKSSSMSRTLARRDLEDFSFKSNSFILFCIMIVFLVIFSPGLAIRSTHGIHWRNNVRTCITIYYIIYQQRENKVNNSFIMISYSNNMSQK